MNLDAFTDEEQRTVKRLLTKLSGHQEANLMHESYYDGSFPTTFLGIGLPDQAKQLKMIAGWPGTAVDVLEERLDVLGWEDDELSSIYSDNALDVEASQVHLDALIYGCSFVSVTAGRDGEPEQLIRGHDAKNTTGTFNPRTGRLDDALTQYVDDKGEVTEIELWTPTQIISAHRDRGNRPWEVVERLNHNLGQIPMVAFVNRPRVGARGGKSEITAAVRRYTNSAVRSLTAMDVNREFFSAPQRWIVGATEDQFVGPDGLPKTPWQTVTGRIWAIPGADDDGQQPKLDQFDPMSPGPYLDQIQGLARMLAAEAAIPATYLGLNTDQAASADAIRAMEARLVKRAERRQTQFGRSWAEVGRLARAGRDGRQVAELPFSRMKWSNPATPTLAATMDAMVKATHAGIAPPASQAVWDRVGFTPDEQRVMKQELLRRESLQRAALIAGASARAKDDGAEAPPRARGDVGLDTFFSGGDSTGL